MRASLRPASTSSFGLRVLRRSCLGWLIAALLAVSLRGQATLVQDGQPVSVIITPNSPTAIITLAAQELQKHLQLMSGATVPIDTLSNAPTYAGKRYIYLGSATGIAAPATLEFYTIRTVNGNLYIVGKDSSKTDYTDLSGCQPGTLFGVYHLLNEILGVNWIWPGDLGIVAPKTATITVPATDVTTGPNMVQRKYRNPRDSYFINSPGVYAGSNDKFIPIIPTDATRRATIGREELLWQRRLRMGTRLNPSFGHSETNWWTNYGTGSANPHPEYFAVLLSGSQPKPNAANVKLHVSGAATIDAKVAEWNAAGHGSNFNVCPNDSRNFCICPTCMAWDYPSQLPEDINSGSNALLADRYARWYTELSKKATAINPNVILYGYAYDVYRHPPIQATIPSNVAIAYVPGSPSASVKEQIVQTQADVFGWMDHGCTKMYLRPNWMLAGHAGPFWPTYRLGNSFRDMLAGGYLLGLDSDSSSGSYCNFGLYYYTVARLMNNPSITVDRIMDEYCSGFGNARARIRDYFSYWENFVYNQSDSGNTDILGWSSGMDAYGTTYNDAAFDGAEKILNDAAALAAGDADATARIAFLRIACIHGRLTAEALRQTTSGTKQTQAYRALLAYRNQTADGFALWREWAIDRESYNKTRADVWSAIYNNPGNYGSNASAAFESTSAPGQIVLEAENATSAAASIASSVTLGAVDGINWVNTTAGGASGTAMQTPNNATAAIETTSAARLDYKVDFTTTGTWYVWVRLAAGVDVNSDSVNTGLDGVVVSKNLQNTTAGWNWVGTTGTSSTRATVNVTTAGVHTFNVWSREDGVILDQIILTTSSSYSPNTPSVGAIGPAQSSRRAASEYLLVVAGGTGDGYYGAGSTVSVAADPAPANYVFDRWTGDTGSLASVTASTTTFTMPAKDARLDATYKLSSTADTDGDGILDSWEIAQFGNLTTATATSDTDGDGSSDRSEFLAGTDPKDPASSLRITSVVRSANGDVTLTWPSTAGKTYRLTTSTTLQSGSWTPLSVDITATAPLNTYTVRADATRQFFRVEVE